MSIKFESVTKKFGQTLILDNINFDIKKGEFVFITGKSGSGKSTMIGLILGEIKPTEGKIWINDLCLNDLNSSGILSVRRTMGVIYQDFRLIFNRTIAENILVALDITKYKENDREEKMFYALEKVGLAGRENFFPSQFSKGELQKICLARTLITNPEIIIADEPTGNLDPESSWELMELLNKINKGGTTIIMSTHNFDIVNSMRKRVIKLKNNKIVSDKKRGKYE